MYIYGDSPISEEFRVQNYIEVAKFDPFSLLITDNTFASRQKMAADLKVLVDRSETMNDEELSKLRADIKVIVQHYLQNYYNVH